MSTNFGWCASFCLGYQTPSFSSLALYYVLCAHSMMPYPLYIVESNRTDVLTDFTILVSELELPPGVMAVLLDGMSQVEHRLAFGTDEKLQAASLVGVFVQARHMMKVA